jgi:hypothetical protein
MRIAIAIALAASSGCMKPATFACTSDTECTRGDETGTCEAVGRCSFPDPSCPTGARFGALSGMYANECVGAPSNGADVTEPIDAPVSPHDSHMADATFDAEPIDAAAIDAAQLDAAQSCPAGYVALPGLTTTHRYRLLATAAGWTNQRAICGAEPANAYLAIPNDAAELHALLALSAADTWVGISDAATEGVYVDVHGEAATFLPWAPGEPDNNGNQDCVRALVAMSTVETNQCGMAAVAICECEP